VAAPSLAVFKARLDRAWSTLVWCKGFLPMAGGWTRWSLMYLPTQIILWFYNSSKEGDICKIRIQDEVFCQTSLIYLHSSENLIFLESLSKSIKLYHLLYLTRELQTSAVLTLTGCMRMSVTQSYLWSGSGTVTNWKNLFLKQLSHIKTTVLHKMCFMQLDKTCSVLVTYLKICLSSSTLPQ